MPLPLIILLPGTDGTGLFFEPLVAELAPHATVQVMAYPQSRPQTYEALGAWLLPKMPQDQDYILVGESFGGPLALWLSARAVRKPVKIILGATFAASPFGHLGRWVSPLLWIGEHLPLWTWQIDLMLFNGRNRDWAGRIHRAVRLIPRKVLLDRVRTVLSCDLREYLTEAGAPVLCLNAGHDRLIPPWLPRHFGKAPNVNLVSLDLPHMIFQSDARTITHRHILPFLKDDHAALPAA